MTQAYEEYLAMGAKEGEKEQKHVEWDANAFVWVSDPAEGFVRAAVVSKDPLIVRPDNASVDVRADLDKPVSAEKAQEKPHGRAAMTASAAPTVLSAARMNPPYLDGAEDMSQLSELNEGSVLNNLRFRYSATRIHTYSGLFLVVVNPYCSRPIYTPKVTSLYEGRRRDEIAPHVFAVADEAYRAMVLGKRNQSILITGESGAGKTENTKRVIQYYATTCRREGSGTGQLEEQMLKANPILEAFGNAKTARNDNSSRFGKFMQIQFNTNGMVAGMKTVHYLLERSRICSRLKGERNFHIFYQLLAGASPSQRDAMKLCGPEDYEYLRAGDTFTIAGVDDAQMFAETCTAMSLFGITEEQQDEIFRVVAAVLWLGNIKFEDNQKEEAFISLASRAALENVATVLGIPVETLEKGLLKKKINAGGQAVVTSQKASMAGASRDALARALYDKLFDWLVKTINQTISHDGRTASFIGVLDIAGFEIFETNSFEQLCINFTNEKLQQFFNHHMFVREQEEYASEKIQWSHQDYGNLLKETIDIIEHPTNGIFSALEEQCFLPAGKNEGFLSKIYGAYGKGASSFQQPRTSNTQFILKHYAGWVTYTVDDWLTRNKNPLHEDLIDATRQSSIRLVQQLFSIDASAAAAAASRRGKSASMETVSSQFRSQLSTLMTTLEQTEPHFIRCIKPNHQKKSWIIDAALVLDQLRCNGVVEGIRISRLGYPLRVPFLEFVKRFRVLTPGALPQSPAAAAERILSATPLKKPEDYQIGTTKVFFRANKNAALEHLRNEKLSMSARRIQRAYRRWVFIRGYENWRSQHAAAKVIQRNTRAWVESTRRSWDKLYIIIKPIAKTGKADEDLRILREEKAALAEESVSLRAEVKEKGVRINELDHELQAQSQRANQLASEVKERRQELAALQAKASRTEETLSSQITELKESLATESLSRAALNKSSVAMRAELQDAQAELAKTKETVASLDAARSQLSSDLATSQDRVASLEKELEQSRAQRAQLAQQLESAQEQIEEGKAELSQAREAESKMKQELANGKKELERAAQAQSKFERAAKQSEARVADLEASLARGQKQSAESVDAAGQQVLELRKQLEQQVSERASVQQELDTTRDELSSLKQRLTKERSEREKLESTSQDLKVKLEASVSELSVEKATRMSLEKTLTEKSKATECASDELGRERSALKRLEKVKKQQDEEFVTITAKLEEAEAKTAARQERVEELERLADDLGLRLENEVRIKGELQNRCDSLEAKIGDLKFQLEENSGKEQSLKSVVREKQILREQIAEEASLRETAEQSLRTVVTENGSLKEKLLKMVDPAKYAQLEKKLAEKELVLSNTQEELDKWKNSTQKETDELSDQLDKKSKEVSEKARHVARLESELRTAKENSESLSNDSKLLQGKLDASIGATKKAQTDNITLKEELDKANQRAIKQKKEAEEQLEEANKQIELLKERISKARQAERAAHQSISNEEVLSARIEIQNLKDALEIQQKNAVTTEKEFSRKLAKMEETMANQLDRERQKHTSAVSSLEEQLAENNRILNEREIEISELSTQLKSEAKIRKELEEFKKSQASRSQIDKVSVEKDKKEILSLKEQLKTLTAEVAAHKAKSARLEERLQEAKMKSMSTASLKTPVELKADIALKENRQLHEQCKDLTIKVRAMQAKIQELQDENSGLTKMSQEDQKEINSLKYQLVRRPASPVPSGQERSEKRPMSSHSRTNSVSGIIRSDSHSVIRSSETQVEEQFAKERTLTQSTLQNLRQELSKCRGQIKVLEENLAREIKQKETQLNSWMTQADKLSAQNATLMSKNQELRALLNYSRRRPSSIEFKPDFDCSPDSPSKSFSEVETPFAEDLASNTN